MALRRRWAGFLVALYVVAVHGLPALHLGWHQGAHVHELGGLRWLRPLSAHTHAHTAHADAAAAESDTPVRTSQTRLRADQDSSGDDFVQHIAAGPAHALSALLTPPRAVAMLPVAASVVVRFLLATRLGRDVRARASARAPPAFA